MSIKLPDTAVLDNMIWSAISSGNSDIATVQGDVGVYHSDIAPFAGMKEWSDANFNKLADLITDDRRIAVSHIGPAILNNKWKLLKSLPCYQMVYENEVDSFTTRNSHLIVPLTEEHIPQMLELTELTKPGPFLQRTNLFGNYFGIFENGRLAAMSGQRMHPTPFLEVSAVCSHPDFQGRGYAKAIMLHVMKRILDNSFTPFLHVLTTNNTAIKLYESIGFRIRTEIFIDMIRKV